MELWTIFLTGLTVGGLSCMAVQGGLLASIIASGNFKNHFFPTTAFLIAKFTSHVILGFLLGMFGSILQLTDQIRIIIQFLAGVYMILVALNLLNVHPIFRHITIQPPKFIFRLVRDESKSKDFFAPILVGFLTILIPCGTTLAMELLVISTGNPLLGALIMGTFVLGTFPLFLGLGLLTSMMGSTIKGKFFKLAGVLVFYLGLSSINGALTLAGRPIEIPIAINLSGSDSNSQDKVRIIDGIQSVDISVYPNGYSPNRIQVQSNLPVRLNLTNRGGLGCTSQFRIPILGISKNLVSNQTSVIEFTPKEKGKIAWTCSMGMYTGVIEVI